MDALQKLLDNPAGLLAIVCLIGVALIANLALAALLRGAPLDLARWRRSLTLEAGLWRRAAAGGRAAQQQQADQLNELHQLVSQLRPPSEAEAGSETPPNPPSNPPSLPL